MNLLVLLCDTISLFKVFVTVWVEFELPSNIKGRVCIYIYMIKQKK